MPATNKDDLLDVTRKEYDKLTKLLEAIDAQTALIPHDDTSIKDVVGHRAHWIDLFLGWYADGQAERPVFFPAEGYKWNELKRYNADLRNRQASLSWKDAKAMLEANYQELTDLLEGLPNEALYGGPMKGANNDWTTGRWAEAAGASHFRSAGKFVRAALRAFGKR